MRTNCNARRPNLTLEDTAKKTILLIDMACPNELHKEAKREKKMRKYSYASNCENDEKDIWL